MNLTFSKELIENPSSSSKRPSKQLRLYTVIDQNSRMAGQFFFHPTEQSFKIDDKEIIVECDTKLFKKQEYFLRDKSTQELVGRFQIVGHGINYFWHDVPSDPNAKISFCGSKYNFRRIAPEISGNPSNEEIQGSFKFRLYALEADGFAEYSFRMNIPFWAKPNYSNFRPFAGTIETNIEDILLLMVAFYLFELEFSHEDTR